MSELPLSLFRRLLTKMRANKREIENLARKLIEEQRRATDFENRLKAVVEGSVESPPFQREYIRMQVSVDRRTAAEFPAVWQEAERQLRNAVRAEMSKR